MKSCIQITLLTALILSCGLAFQTQAAEPNQAAKANPTTKPKKRPNILLIYADDQSYKTISSYGANPDWVATPNIDAIAKRGVRFERAYLGAWCMPSRASILTGRLQHGINSMRMEGEYPGSEYDPEKTPFLPAQFRKQGYQTAQIGKWHTGVDSGYGRDWDYQVVWNRPKYPENAGNYFYNQILEVNGKRQMMEGYSTDKYTDWAVDYIKGENREEDKPWYLWLCYGAIHGPTTPADRHEGKLAGNSADIPQDILGPWPDKPKYLEDAKAWMRAKDGTLVMRKLARAKSNFDTIQPGQSLDAWVQQYNECNMGVDQGVGRVMAALKASGQLENTLVVYTADQGYGLGEHGFNQKVAPYDATIASALMISYPGHTPENKLCKQPVNAPDLMDYLCRMAEVKIPWKMHGRDIRPLVKQPEDAEWNSNMLFTHTGRKYGTDTDKIPTGKALVDTAKVPWYVMMRDGDFKYIRILDKGETEELYDLRADPEELKNLANDSKHAEQLKTLRAAAKVELTKTDAGFVDSMPATKQMLDGK